MKAVKLLWLFSFLAYLAVALYIYATAEDPLQVPSGDGGGAYPLSKQSLFYYGLTGLVLVNALVLLLANSAAYMSMPFKRRWQRDAALRQIFKSRAKEWIRGFALLGNLILLNLQLSVYTLNVDAFNIPVTGIFTGIGLLLLAWLLAYFPIFSKVPE